MKKINLNLGGGKLWQFSNKSRSQMMSYLIETPDKKYIMIDGGHFKREDAEFLHGFLKNIGGHINAWFITHAHDDHFGALLYMLENNMDDIKIDNLYFDFPPTEWFKGVEDGSAYDILVKFNECLEKKNIKPQRTYKGQIFDFGIKIKILNSPENYNAYTSVNDTSICIKVFFKNKTVLFLGDIAVAGENDLIKVAYNDLKSDIVQMAHHGQQGADKHLYEIINPAVCLWTTPDWLWDNDLGEGVNTGPFKTFETRKWVEELGITENYTFVLGDYQFE